MQTLETLEKKIRTASDLLSVVKTMKMLAAVNIRQYENAVMSLENYRRVVDSGWRALLRQREIPTDLTRHGMAVLIVIGTDQGMCGKFNEIIVETALAEKEKRLKENIAVDFWAVGEKIAASLEDGGTSMALRYQAPGSLHAVDLLVGEMMEKLEKWKMSHNTEHFYLCHHVISNRMSYGQTLYPILPLNQEWVDDRTQIPWPGKCIPMIGLSYHEMFSRLFRQYLYIAFFRAFAQSLASENAARFATMQAAEKNIAEMEGDLRRQHRERRQTGITNELLDIISGFEALKDTNV